MIVGAIHAGHVRVHMVGDRCQSIRVVCADPEEPATATILVVRVQDDEVIIVRCPDDEQ